MVCTVFNLTLEIARQEVQEVATDGNINHLFYIQVDLCTGGLIFGMIRVLVNWWAYTWGDLYSEVYGIAAL